MILGLIALYSRVILNLSLITINYTLNYHKELLPSNILLTVKGEGNPMPDSTPPISNKSKQFIFFQKNNNNVHNIIPNAAISRMGLLRLFCSVCIGGGIILYAKKTYDAQMQNNFEITRQNDAKEVSQGFMTREEYIKNTRKDLRKYFLHETSLLLLKIMYIYHHLRGIGRGI